MPKIKIGVIIADSDEYTPFVEAVSENALQPYEYFGRQAVAFNLHSSEIVCLNCGIGKVNAAIAAAHLIDSGCKYILNFGLSGGVSGVRKGSLVLPDKFLEHDFDLTGIGYKPCEKPGQRYIYEADAELSKKALSVLGEAARGTAVCGDRFICSEADRDFLSKTFGATTCDMETAAIAAACDMARVPFLSLRRVSDDAGEDAYVSYSDMNVNDGMTLAQVFIKVLNVISKGE